MRMFNFKFFLVASIVFVSLQCEDNGSSTNPANDCGLKTTFIKDIENINELGNASGSAIKMLGDCSYVGVGHRAGVPWVTKFNESGEQVWDKIFDEIPVPQGNYGNGLIYATGVDKTDDGGLIIVCATTSTHPSYNASGRIIKVDSSGVPEWISEFPTNRPYHGRDVIQTMEGDYIVVGSWYTTSAVTNEKSAFMARYDVDGNLIWIERYGGECDEDEFQAVIQKPDGGFIAVGKFEHESPDYNCDFYGYTDLWFVNTDSDGQIILETKTGDSYWESAFDIVDIGDGTYGLAGRRRHQKRKPSNAWYIRMDESGNVVSEWHEPDYVNSSGRNDALYNLVLLPDRETVVALGYKDDGSGDSQYLWAFNAKTSEEIWSASYNEPGRGYSLGISNAHDGGLIFFGKKDTGRLKIFKTDENGIVISGQ